MRLFEVVEQSRTTGITEEQFIDLKPKIELALEKYKNNIRIYRSITPSEAVGDILVSDPTKSERRSLQGKNYYTWLIDNSEYWEGYPKRSKSLICSSSPNSFNTRLYVVLPFGNPTIGICKHGDIWVSFTDVYETLGIHSMVRFEYIIDDLIMSQDNTDYKTNFSNKEEFFDKLKSLKRPDKDLTKISSSVLNNIFVKHRNPLEQIQYLLNPKLNRFSKKSLSSYTLRDTDQEVWFSAPAVLIKQDILDKYIEDGII
jgi:hypothetical protein